MADTNRLELVISLKDDSSAGAESIKARYKAIVDDARQMNVLLDKEVERMSASGQRSVDAYLRRTEMAGKDTFGKLDVRRDQLIAVAKGDEDVIRKLNEGTERIKDEYRKRQAAIAQASAVKEQGRQDSIFMGNQRNAGLSFGAAGAATVRAIEERENLLSDLESRAAVAGKKRSERLLIEGREIMSGLVAGGNPDAIRRGAMALNAEIAATIKAEAEAGGHGAGSQALRRGGLAIKDLAEGSSRGFFIELTDIFTGTSGSGGLLPGMISGFKEITGLSTVATYAVGGFTAALGALGLAGVISVRSLAETGEQIRNFSTRTGIAPENVQKFQFAATAAGVDESIFPRMTRALAQISDDDSSAGVKGRAELKQLGVSIYDTATGQLKPSEQIIIDIADAFAKLPEGLQKSAASLEIFKRAGIDAPIVLKELRAGLATSDEIGNTFSKADLDMMEEWDKSLKAMSEDWKRFRLQFEMPLAITVTAVLRIVGPVAKFASGKTTFDASEGAMNYIQQWMEDAFGYAGQQLNQFGQQVGASGMNPFPMDPELPAKNAQGGKLIDPNRLGESIQFQRAQAARAEYDALRGQDPKFALAEARKKQAALDAAAEHGDEDAVRLAKEGFVRLQSLEKRSNPDANKGLQDIIAARQEGLNLDAQIAKQRVTDQAEILRAGMGSKSGLASQRDIEEELDLAKLAARAETASEVNKRQFRIDTKTGRKIDESSDPGFREFKRIQEQELEPKRVQEEYNKILTRMLVDSAKFYRSRTDESMKHYEEEWHRREERELEVQGEIAKIGNEISDRRTQFDIEANERAKNIAIESLGAVNKQTLKDKMSLEDQKFAIEKDYADRGLALQLQRLNTERARAIAEIEKKDRDRGIDPTTDPDTQRLIGLTNDKYQQDADALRAAAGDKELSDALKTAKAKEDLQIQSNRKIYDSLKQDAAGLFDQLVFHTKSWGAFAKDMLKSVVLTPIKEIFSSQVAGLFTGLFTGNKVTFDPLGTGKGRLGALEAAYGRAGGGQPNFHVPRETPLVSSKLESTVEGNAVRVIVTNPQQVGAAHAQAAQSSYAPIGASLANSFGSTILSHTRAAQQQGLASSLFIPQSYGGESGVAAEGSDLASSFNNLIMSGARNNQLQGFGNAYSDTAGYGTSANGFATMGEIAGIGSHQGIFSEMSGPTAPAFEAASPLANFAGGTDNLANSLFAQSLSKSLAATPARGGFLSQLGGIFGLGGGGVHGTPPFLYPTDPRTGLPIDPGMTGGTSGSASGGGGGILGNVLGGGKGGFLGGFKSMFGLDTAGTDMGGGVGIARTGLGGNLAAISKSGGFAMLGGLAAMDGIRRGGVLGTLEAAGGGAAVGFKYGGPIGAAIGAAIGGGLALAKTFGLFGYDRKHAKDLVKQVYGMDINSATADSIVQIAKQSFGGQIDVAVRSQQVRDLLKLYSQATGQKKAEDMFVQSEIHGASLVEANGKLAQQAIYDNGNAYAYSSQLGTYQGVQTSPLSTYAPNNGVFSGNVQINLNGQSAADVLEGRVTNVVTPGFVQGKALAAGNASIGRASQTRMTLSPSAIPG